MKNTFMITVAAAALVAGAGLASAQGVNERRDPPAAASPQSKVPEGKTDQKTNVPKTSVAPAPSAQAPDTAKPAPSVQAPEKAKPAPTAQVPEKAKPAPIAQAPEKAPGSKPESTGQGTGTPSSQSSSPPNAQPSGRNAAPNVAAQVDSKPGASVAPLSTEQHARFRETMRGEKSERLTKVPFSISVGEAVPSTVRLYRWPAGIVDYAPQYRDYQYFLVGDDILVVDPRTHRIVAVIAA